MHSRLGTRIRLLGLAAVGALTVAACGAGGGSGATGGGGSGGGGNAVRVLMVNNPQQVELQALTSQYFTKQTGIKVDFKVLPENDVRNAINQDVSNQAGQYDVVSISNFETPFFAKNHWLTPLTSYIANDPSFDVNDVLKPMRTSLTGPNGQLYAVPFYGESSFLMYRKDIFAKLHLKMPMHPTWPQVAALAQRLNGAQPGMKGICLRGQPGWGEVVAPLTTVVNTYGGTWFTKNWQAQLTASPFENATNFYVNLVQKYGEPGAAESGFTECLNDMSQSKVAMWYDATSAAGALEDPSSSKVVGKIGYVFAPTLRTPYSGWLYTWAWGLENTTKGKAAQNAWKFMSWASSKAYEQLVAQKQGWASVPNGTRTSLYQNPAYQKAASAFYNVTLQSIEHANVASPGVQPRPTLGIQFVDIPQFENLGTNVSQLISNAIAGKTSVSSALSQSQSQAQSIGASQK
jgi:sorbitol/mannitol transport system substrate-binding protein